MRHVISALVMNEPGVLANVAGMFAARGFNIDSLVVGRTENPDLSRMTIVVNADDNTIDQVRKQLAKLVPVVGVHDFQETRPTSNRDLAPADRHRPAGTARRSDRDRQPLRRQSRRRFADTMMVELAGTEEKIEAFVELMQPYGIKELARTGVIAMARGASLRGQRLQRPGRRESESSMRLRRPPCLQVSRVRARPKKCVRTGHFD